MNRHSSRRQFLRLTAASLSAVASGLDLSPTLAADQAKGILRISRSNARLRIPASTPEGQIWRYCIPFPFQIAARKAGMIINIRGNHPGDFEVGTDFITFDSLSAFEPGKALAISRIERGTNPNTQPTGETCWMIKQWVRMGFAPLGAKRKDGSAHPHAGTGFGINEVIAWPLRDKNAREGADPRPSDPYGGREHYSYHEVRQFAYDGTEFRVTESEEVACDELLPGWNLWSGGMTTAVPDGDDFIIPFTGGPKPGSGGIGLLRWRRQAGKWRPVEFRPALDASEGHDSFEPSLVRAPGGAWFLSARGGREHAKSIRVWRSDDEGKQWKRLLSLPGVVPRSPVTLHQAGDGSLFIAANLIGELPADMAGAFPLPKGADGKRLRGWIRETLCLWPLDVENARLKDSLVIRDGRASFGPSPGGIAWTIDHPLVANLRLSDGQWHTVLGHRVLDRAETVRGFAPPPQTGAYLEEVFSAGAAVPAWRF
jgi:hypothetical protein